MGGSHLSSEFSSVPPLMERLLARQIRFLSLRQLFFVLRELLLELEYRLDSVNQLELSSSDSTASDSSEDSCF